MADLKISQLNSLAGGSLASNDVVAVVDTSASETKKITSVELVRYGYGLISADTLDGDVIEPGTTTARGTVQLTDSTSSTSTTTAATPNAVKGAYDLANAAMPKAGGTFTGNISFEGSTADDFETTFAITDPTADRTITFKDESGTVAYLSDISGISSFLPLTGGTMTGQILGDNSTSASTPGYAFDGDPNTGLYTTGADELALTTGGSARLTIDSTGTVVIPGNFTVQGTTTTIDTTTLVVEDKNIEMGAVATPTDVTADGGGITLKGTTDKTINWVDATDAWTSSERFSVPTGTAAAPTLTFTGDENTGIYSPGADQVAISTNGTGRLFVDASGRLLAGTNAAGATNADDLTINSTGDCGITIRAGNTSSSSILFADGTTGDENYRGYIEYDHNGDYLRLATAASERLRITSDGKLGLGTSSPAEKLDIASDAPVLRLTDTDTALSDGEPLGEIHFYSSDLDNPGNAAKIRTFGLGATGQVGMAFDVRNTGSIFEALRIDSLGRVGVGTTSPTEALEVVGNAILDASNAALRIKQGTTGTTGAIDFTFNTDSTSYGSLNLDYDSRTTQGLRLNTPYPLTLECGAAEEILFKRTTTESARIDSSGRLLVGTSSSAAYGAEGLLQILGTTNAHASIARITDNDAPPTFNLAKARGSTGAPTIVSSGDSLGRINFAGYDGTGYTSTCAWIQAQVDGTPAGSTPGPVSMPGRLVFSTTADGASSPTERMRISQNGVVTLKNGAVAEIDTLTDAATITPDFAAACNFTVTLGGNRTIANPTNLTAGQSGSIFLVQDATGSRTLSWGSYWDFAGGTAPTLSTAANAVDRVDYIVRSSTSIHTVFTADYS